MALSLSGPFFLDEVLGDSGESSPLLAQFFLLALLLLFASLLVLALLFGLRIEALVNELEPVPGLLAGLGKSHRSVVQTANNKIVVAHGEHGDDEALGVRADRARPPGKALRRPCGVAAMRAWHVVRIRGRGRSTAGPFH